MKPMIFHMKQFDLHQEASAMKIGTDGVLIGAWNKLPEQGSVWDIGTGTGLIALMAAQRSPNCFIKGFEIDPIAAAEARTNIQTSPWQNRIEIICGDAILTASTLPSTDAIVSNPPFFTTTLKSPDIRRSDARHGGSLSVQSLIELASAKLSPTGTLSLIAPADRLDEIEETAYLNRLNMQRICTVSSTEFKSPIRVMVQIGRTLTHIERSHLSIRTTTGEYTEEYRTLTQDFYTHL